MSRLVSLVLAASFLVVSSSLGASSAHAAPLPARQPLCIEVPGGSADDIAVINITNTDATADGYGALRASDATPIPSRPASGQYSSVNFAQGEPNPNLALVPIGPDGRSCYDSDGGSANVILDLVAIIPATNVNAIEPLRLRDTRDSGRLVAPRTPLCLTLPPAAAAGDIAVINITNTDATADGYGALRASDARPIPTRPTADQYSSVNFAPGRTDPNLAVVTTGPAGGICYDSDGGSAHVILDLIALIPAANIVAIDPERLTDTRPSRQRVNARSPLCVAIPGGTAGAAAVINITNTDATGPGYGALRASQARQVPSRAPADQFSSVNYAAGATNPNLTVVTIGSDGRVCYDSDGGSTHVILDLVAIIPAANINAIEPTRIRDTRSDTGPTHECENPPVSDLKVRIETDLPSSHPQVKYFACGMHAGAAALPGGLSELLLLAFDDRERLAARTAELTGSPVEQIRGWLTTSEAFALDNPAIVWNLSLARERRGIQEDFSFKVGAHEWYHTYTGHQFHLGGLPDPVGRMLLKEPVWMLEATAEWFALEQAALYGYDTLSQQLRDVGARYGAPRFVGLSQWETSEGFQSGPNYEMLPHVGDVLVRESSRTAFLRTYWEARALTTEPWQSTFEDVFGIDVPTFYAKVKQHMLDIQP